MLAPLQTYLPEIEALCRRYGVLRLDAFGSVVRGDFREGESDLDFLVEFEDRGWHGAADRYFGLLEGLEDLFGVQVDLVVDSAIENTFFRSSVDQGRVALYAA